MEVRRGEVWLADLSPVRGSEQAGVRPVLVVQTDRANPFSPHTIIVPFTTRIRKTILPSHVRFKKKDAGLTEDSVLLCEQIRVLDRGRLIRKMGHVPADRMTEVHHALKAILDL